MILVTGANGYLGSHVLQTLAARGLPHVGTTRCDCDLMNPSSVWLLIVTVKPDVIIHCAAAVPNGYAGYEDQEAARDSVVMVRHLNAYRQCPMVFASSMTVDDAHAYGHGKREAEALLRDGDVAVRLLGLFGLPRRSGLVYNAAKAYLAGRPFTAAPCEGWAAMHVTDAADALVDVAETPTEARVLTIDYPEAVFRQRLREFVADVQRDGV